MPDRFKALRNSLLLASVPEIEVDQLVPLVRSVKVAENETYAVRGQPLSGLVLVDSGALEVLFESSPICCLSPGSLFGEDALVSDAMAPATLRAAIPGQLGLLERKIMLREIPRLPNLRDALERAYRRRVLAARLYQIDIFQALSDSARLALLDRFEVQTIPGGAVLAERGMPGDGFVFIREGEALLHMPPDEGAGEGAADGAAAEPQTATLKVGDYLGDTTLVDDRPHTATVTAPYDLVVMKLSRDHFQEALAAYPADLGEAMAAYRRRSESIL
jgi:CRP-like cAMP-binding protein